MIDYITRVEGYNVDCQDYAKTPSTDTRKTARLNAAKGGNPQHDGDAFYKYFYQYFHKNIISCHIISYHLSSHLISYIYIYIFVSISISISIYISVREDSRQKHHLNSASSLQTTVLAIPPYSPHAEIRDAVGTCLSSVYACTSDVHPHPLLHTAHPSTP